MHAKLSQHLKDKEDLAEFKSLIKTAKPVLDRLADILNKDKDVLEQNIRSYDFLILPGTKERLVARLAEIRRLEQVIKLLEV